MNKIITFATMAIVVSMAIYFSQLINKLDARISRLSNELVELQRNIGEGAGLSREVRRLAEVTAKISESDNRLRSATIKTESGQEAASASGGFGFDRTSGESEKQARTRLQDQNLRTLNAAYGAMFRQFGMNSEDQKHFMDVKRRIMDKAEELVRPALSQQGPARSDAIEAAKQQVIDFGKHLIESEFGAETAKAIAEYEDSIPLRPIADNVSATLMHGGEPLTLQQSDALMRVIAQNSRGPNGKVDPIALRGDLIIQEAQGILNPSQLEALRHALEQYPYR